MLQGAQQPRFFSPPEEIHSSAGAEAVELAAMAGLNLDPWQRLVLEYALAERKDGTWAASRVGLVVPRQNGKGALLEARELAGLFLLGERLIIHSAHQFDTSLEAFGRLLSLIENNPDLEKRVRRVSRSHGEEGITLSNGQRIRFRTRTKGGGRGFTADCVILDEAMILPESTLAALLPTLSARPNPQVWYTGSAVDRLTHEDGVVLTRIRRAGHLGDNPRLAYFEWALDFDSPDEVPEDVASAPESWAQANPGLGIRIDPETVSDERGDLSSRDFAVERLGVGDWPDLGDENALISLQKWAKMADPASICPDIAPYALDVSPERSWSSISRAGTRPDGFFHVEVVRRSRGTGWCVEFLSEIKPATLVIDGASPAAALLPDLQRELVGTKIVVTTGGELARACGAFYDAADAEKLRHPGTPELAAAIRGAVTRPLGDAWAWSRKNSSSDITALVSVTLALWGVVSQAALRPWVGWGADDDVDAASEG